VTNLEQMSRSLRAFFLLARMVYQESPWEVEQIGLPGPRAKQIESSREGLGLEGESIGVK
jgi:hypothetical protein